MRVFFASLLLTAACSAVANQPDLQLVGEARLKVLFWQIYESRLFTADGGYSEGQRPLRLDIQYLRDIQSAMLVSRTADEWKAQGLNHQRQPEWLEALTRLWPDVRKNDVISLQLDAQNRSTFFYNGERVGVLDDPDFGQHFVDIWLSPNTTRPEIRLALLGVD